MSKHIDQAQRLSRLLAIVLCSLCIAACGGGGGSRALPINNTPPSNPPLAQTDFEQGIFSASSRYKDICLNPRSGNFPDTAGSATDENEWVRAWSHELYLWYDEIIDEDPRDFATPQYFDLMQTFELSPTGAPKDRFHFTFDTEAWQALSSSGVSAGYGAEFELLSSSPPRRAVVAYVVAGSPAAGAGLTRGAVVIEVDGVDFENGDDVDTINAGLFPDAAGEAHSFVVEDFDGSNRRSVSMTSAQVTEDPVPFTRVIDTPSGPVGYMLFNTHIATAESRLVEEVNNFAGLGVVDLILDLRYNGGGFLDIANELGFMIAGPSAASGRVFDETQFSDKHPTTNPVTGAALTPDFFHTTTQGFSLAAGNPLPSLNLPRVVILSQSGTCSASEAIINGLRGIDVEVIMIGGTSCGKPYGFFPQDNCGTTYFTIQFRGVNAKGFGDYSDGFVPTETPLADFEVPGCVIDDDFSRDLGDLGEAQLSAALEYLENGACPVPPTANFVSSTAKRVVVDNGDGQVKPSLFVPGAIRR
ncbi:MAG: S41 family peptidase [Pseudomonadota bacterium]